MISLPPEQRQATWQYRRAWEAYVFGLNPDGRRALDAFLHDCESRIIDAGGVGAWYNFSRGLPGFTEFWAAPHRYEARK